MRDGWSRAARWDSWGNEPFRHGETRKQDLSDHFGPAHKLREEDFAGLNKEWIRWFPANPHAQQGAHLPVRIPGMKISIAVIAEA
jgi:hypothetical protein